MMHSVVAGAKSPSEPRARHWQAATEIALIFLVFFIQGAWPAPEVNEPHYLSKAKHYWDNAWCQRDFFCNTADAHLVFYWTFGWLSRLMSLPSMAWCGRVVTWALLAWGWRRLSAALVPGAWYAVFTAALFVTLNDRASMAGEWIVGGVEAKGFAYVLVLLALGAIVRRRYALALPLLGGAAAFHVIVGGWALVAATLVWLTDDERPSLRELLAPLAIAAVLTLIGLAPAVALTFAADPSAVRDANQIYVFNRLAHHLAPETFPAWLIWRHVALVGVLVVLVRVGPGTAEFRRLRTFVAAAVALAAVGMAIGLAVPWYPNLTASLLRFYWFRLSDVMVPLGVAIYCGAIARGWQVTRPAVHAAAMAAAIVVAGGHLGQLIWQRKLDPRPRADVSIENLAAWREACAWAAKETPPDAVFLTPRLAQTFRWYAGRAEVVSYKDIPQDAAGIVEWWRRLYRIHVDQSSGAPLWCSSLAELGADRLNELAGEFGADYVVTTPEPPLKLERVGPISPSVAIYRLRPSKP